MTTTGEDIRNAVRESVAAILADADRERDGFDPTTWDHLAAAGFTRLTWPEAHGGAAAGPDLAAIVLAEAGAHAARVPLVEADLAAGWLVARTGLPVGDGPVVAVATEELELDRRGPGTHVRARVRSVPDARSLQGILAVGAQHVVLLDPASGEVGPSRNLAGEERDELIVDTVLDPGLVFETGDLRGELRLRSALGRAQLLSGALRATLDMAVAYAGVRVQFGRPIAAFQAVQQELALAAGEAAAAASAAGAAAETATRDGFAAATTRLAVGAAKARASEAAGAVASIAHQIHGAIGFTREHHLRLLTGRLWAWRDEDGSEAYWHRIVGQQLLAGGPGRLWPSLTGA